MIPIRQKEILRYLGYRGSRPVTVEIQKKIDACIALLQREAVPRMASGIFSIQFCAQNLIQIGSMQINSRHLGKHLQGCTAAILFAATLGSGVDRLMSRFAQTDTAMMAVLQASAAEMLESYCDVCEDGFKREAAKKTLYLKSRFSPGYGDFDIHHQKDFIQLLNLAKRIGLTMTDSFMLVPTKSVTAIIGVTAERQEKRLNKCAGCTAKNCSFRKE